MNKNPNFLTKGSLIGMAMIFLKQAIVYLYTCILYINFKGLRHQFKDGYKIHGISFNE